jgi:hypothetical protein
MKKSDIEITYHPMLVILLAGFVFLISSVVFGGTPGESQALVGEGSLLLGKVTAAFLSLMIALRGIAEVMMRIAPALGARGQMLSQIAGAVWVIGNAIGKFGYGTPKPLVRHIESNAIENQTGKGSTVANIKNTIEVFDALDALAKALAESKRDGEINIWDAPKFAPALVAGRKAIADADQIKVELAELDEQEIQLIMQRCMASLTALASAILTKPEVK